MGQLDGRTALITGGAHGFGRAIALRLAREGADVAVADIGRSRASERFAVTPDRESLDRTVQAIEALGRRAIGLLADVRQADDCARMADATMQSFDKIDILCANAGTFLDRMVPAWELAEDEWDVILDVNLKGVWLNDANHTSPLALVN